MYFLYSDGTQADPHSIYYGKGIGGGLGGGLGRGFGLGFGRGFGGGFGGGLGFGLLNGGRYYYDR